MARIIPGLRPNRPNKGARKRSLAKDHGIDHAEWCFGKHCYECGKCLCDTDAARCFDCIPRCGGEG